MVSPINNDPVIVARRFLPIQLTRARELRALTKSALAGAIGKTPSAISQFESGELRPDPATIGRLAMVLAVPVGFFARPPLVLSLAIDSANFRARRSVSQYLRRQALRIGELVAETTRVLEAEGILFEPEQVSSVHRVAGTDAEIESIAADVRRGWGLGLGPIHEPIALLESKGVWVLPLEGACAQVDAFSMWHDRRPFVFVSLAKPVSRIHFDAMHELGHLVMHVETTPEALDLEAQADRFAGAFLLPRESFIRDCPRRWNLAVFQSLKREWRVSIQALVVRAHQLGQLSTSSYRRAFIELNRRKMREHEGEEWAFAPPVALKSALALVADDISIDEIAARIALFPSDYRRMLATLLHS